MTKIKKNKMRFDDTSEEEEPRPKNKSFLNEDDFAPIGSTSVKN